MLKIPVESATIVRRKNHPDHVSLNLCAPEAVFPYEGRLSVSFTASKNTAEAYLERHFPGLKFNVIEDNIVDIPFSKKET
jgi:hypothetical protein